MHRSTELTLPGMGSSAHQHEVTVSEAVGDIDAGGGHPNPRGGTVRYAWQRRETTLGLLGRLFGGRPLTGEQSAGEQCPPLARTSLEARLYLDLHPCACGAATALEDGAILTTSGGLTSRVWGTCPGCGTYREFVFRTPGPITTPDVGVVTFGDGTPSELLDPGEWLWVADQYADASGGDTSELDPKARRAARQRAATAVAAVDQVLAFLPGTAKEVPAGAFRSDRGRSVYLAEPGRFTRDRLHLVRDTYQRILDELDAEAK